MWWIYIFVNKLIKQSSGYRLGVRFSNRFLILSFINSNCFSSFYGCDQVYFKTQIKRFDFHVRKSCVFRNRDNHNFLKRVTEFHECQNFLFFWSFNAGARFLLFIFLNRFFTLSSFWSRISQLFPFQWYLVWEVKLSKCVFINLNFILYFTSLN